ncbi:hypothetical protein SO802_031388 [Lithocarpus litseifolius]|uniref:Uncharacterized protein n=1 Tax=Lithocarpus litseifolius TaxID=425828 RepID=A0AAW2BMP9_9ROSI
MYYKNSTHPGDVAQMVERSLSMREVKVGYNNIAVGVPEWLSGMTRNHVGSARAVSFELQDFQRFSRHLELLASVVMAKKANARVHGQGLALSSSAFPGN